MMTALTKKQFDVLSYLERNRVDLTQRKIAHDLGFSLGVVNLILSTLSEEGYVFQNAITDLGVSALEPFRVKKAIFIAAGMGSRLTPITLNTPKALIRIKGVRIIDTLLDAVVQAGITDIVIVRGYLGEQFDQLLVKYPTIRFFDNGLFNETNNISSMMCVKDQLANAYVFDADLYLYKPSLIGRYQYQSNYLGVPVERTDDWCLTSKNNLVTGMQLGGYNCHHMFGVSYWSKEDGERLESHLEKVYQMPGGKEIYWDQVVLDYYMKEYKLTIRECAFEDIIEIDTFKELQAVDCSYKV